MRIDASAWHARAYREWRKESGCWERDNLCLYVRAVLIYWPLRWLFFSKSVWRMVADWLALFLLVNMVCYRTFGMKWLRIEAGLIGYVCLIACGVALVFFVAWAIQKTRRAEPITSFVDVLAERAGSAHRRICPLIEFSDDPEPEAFLPGHHQPNE